MAFAQNGTLTGEVRGPNGEELIGASVTIEGMSTGTVTDIDGKYSLELKTFQKSFVC